MVKHTVIFTLFIVGMAAGAQSQTRYVSDELFVNLRTGQGDQYRITKILRSGTRMEILENGDTTDWIRVRTAAGDEGWVRTQYLQDGPIARDLLVQAQAKIAELNNKQSTLNSSASEIQTQNQTLQEELTASQTEAARYSQELEELKRISANAVQLNASNQKLMEERQILETEIDVLKAENERLSDKSHQTWFMYGAIAVAIGVFLTLLIQRIRARRKYSEWA